MADLKILSFGAGAIGTYIGGSLGLAGNQLIFVEQASAAGDLRTRGMRLDLSLDKRRKLHEASLLPATEFVVTASLEDALQYGPFDVALYALKSYDTPGAIEEMRPLAGRLPPVWCLSNGVDNEPMLAELLGAGRVIAGTVTSAVGRRGAGDVVLEKLRGVGVALTHPRSQSLVDAANKAFLNAQGFANPLAMKWSKLLTNLIANPTSAILDMTAAEVFSDRKLYALEVAMLRECLAVMAALRIPVVDLPGTPVRVLAFATRLPLWLSRPFLARAAGAGRGGKMPSFHIDLHSGRGKSEVEFLHGAVVRAGEKAGVPTPVNRALTETLLALTKGDLPLERFAHNPRELLAVI